ncbi:MAG: TolC family outer membrane protein [Burkholderiales bacterium]|nr:MAG: TolC family outer membrane protein [Burkholderiales bacterium]
MKVLPTVLFSWLVAGLALGAAPAASAYDLLQAYRDALAYDAQLAAARAQLAATRERVPQAQAGLKPSVAGSVNLTQQYNSVDNPNTGTNDSDYLAQQYAVQLSYPLYRLQNVEAVEQSKLSVSLGELQFAEAEQDLVLRVAEAYFDVLAAQDNLGAIQAQKRAISEQLAAAKRNFEVGTTTITDQQEAQARFDLVTAQEIAASNQLDTRRSALVVLTGKTVAEIDLLRAGVTLAAPQPASDRAWIEQARASNLTVQQAQAASEIAKREIDRQRYTGRPTVDLVSSLSHVRNASSSVPGLNVSGATIGLQVAIPLYTGGAVDARVREAIALYDRSQRDLENARRQADQAARQLYSTLMAGLAQVSALEAAERSSQLALESNQLGYEVGVRINIDVLNAQQQLYTTQRDLASARYGVIVGGLRLRRVAGSLGESDLNAVNALLGE